MSGQGWLLLALVAVLAMAVAVASAAVRRRLGRGAGLLAGGLLGTIGAVVLAGLVVLVNTGPDGVRRIARLMSGGAQGVAHLLPSLPGILTPTPEGVAPSLDLSGIVTRVRDGDTIVVGRTPIRFSEVDCAEAGTPEGERATAALRRLADGLPVRCRLLGRRSYDRELGICALADGRDLGRTLVAQGLCTRRGR